jgi:hypothetical protein
MGSRVAIKKATEAPVALAGHGGEDHDESDAVTSPRIVDVVSPREDEAFGTSATGVMT